MRVILLVNTTDNSLPDIYNHARLKQITVEERNSWE